ncbi:lytic transglycosylase domain-containing protein [Massilia sp. TS11]|nr:lytic transglycosylase domain-containing protein [Massilia sp. TS11]MCG2584773.1 lytic transglycosylase domain-containing protein [Massilia sp. TS11]
MWIAGAWLAVASLCAPLAWAQSPDPSDDDTFLLLREAARQDDAAKANALASRLPHYVIPSYVDYYQLKPRLKEASADEVRAFLKKYEGSAIADRLRNDWLLELGRKRDWANFDQQLPLYVVNDDTQVKCYGLLSRLNKGQKVADDARALLVNPTVYGEACSALIAALRQSGQFDTRDLFVQLRLAGEFNATGPARRAAGLLGASESRAAQAVDLPALAIARGVGSTRAEHEIYLIAVSRLARTSHKLAVAALNKAAKKLSAEELALGWAYLAQYASLMVLPEAPEYWKKAEGAPLSYDAMQWKARIALRQGDWAGLKAQINAMPARVREEPVWVYWLGRALAREGSSEQANALFRRIADQNSFYGQLALEELGQKISIPPSAAPLTPAEIAPMAANPGLQRALKFFSLRLRFEGTREWNWELRKMGERELLAAAEFARQNDVLDRMVHTSERTRSEFDYTQRFPTPHNDILHPTAQGLGLDRAWVYGLIRQESRFIMDARSSVGAAGLMQVMPSTAKYVARKIGLTEYGHDQLHDLRTNITLGSNYLSMILASMDGSQTLATAAYNAGPGRLRSWRAALTGPLEGAVWVENIPFPETRSYVKNVLTNATNYAALFEGRPQSLKARLGTVGPKSTSPNAAPELP